MSGHQGISAPTELRLTAAPCRRPLLPPPSGQPAPTGLQLQTHMGGLLPPHAPRQHCCACTPTPAPCRCICSPSSAISWPRLCGSPRPAHEPEGGERSGAGTEALPAALHPAGGRVPSSRQLVPPALLCLPTRSSPASAPAAASRAAALLIFRWQTGPALLHHSHSCSQDLHHPQNGAGRCSADSLPPPRGLCELSTAL